MIIRGKQNVNSGCKKGKCYIQLDTGTEPRLLNHETDFLIHCTTMVMSLLLGGNILFLKPPNYRTI